MQIRLIVAPDAEAIRRFVRSLLPETRHLRFMGALNELDPQTVDRLTRIDYLRDAALIAIMSDRGSDRTVGRKDNLHFASAASSLLQLANNEVAFDRDPSVRARKAESRKSLQGAT